MGKGFKRFYRKVEKEADWVGSTYALPSIFMDKDAFKELLALTEGVAEGEALDSRMCRELFASFLWARTEQGHYFWDSIFDKEPLTEEHIEILNSWREQWE